MMTRGAQYTAFVVAVLAGLFFIAMPFVNPGSDPGQPDEAAYWLAALRLREGLPLYAPSYADEGEVYRYAPWFAMAWVPLTFLPWPVAYFLWELLLAACAVWVVYRLATLGGMAAAVLAALALPLIGAVAGGNVTVALTALLLWRRCDPISVGLAGSLKVYPLAMCAGYVAERRWRDLGIAVAIPAVLWLPALGFGLEHYPATLLHTSDSLWSWAPWLTVVPVAAVTWFTLKGSRWTWLAVGAAIPLLVPHYAGLTYIFAAAGRLVWRSQAASSSVPQPRSLSRLGRGTYSPTR